MTHIVAEAPSAAARLLAWPRSILGYLFLSLYILLVGPPAVLLASLMKRPGLVVALGVAGVRVARCVLGLRYDIEGLDHVAADRPTVYCMNHASNVDVLVFEVLFERCRRLKGLYKAELNGIPVLRSVLRVVEFVPLQRGNRVQTARAIEQATRMLREGDSFLIAPEGTRSRTGELLPFKKGAFVMAIAAQACIVPIAVSGGRDAMARGSGVIRAAVLRVRIGAPIPTAGTTDADRERLVALVRLRIEEMLEEPGSAASSAGRRCPPV